MRARWQVLPMVLALGALYAGYPYATLYRLNVALRQADATTLRSLVDWYAVREGLKEDLCDMATDDPADSHASNELPPFGAGFVRGITGNMLDKNVTPETLVFDDPRFRRANARGSPGGVGVFRRSDPLHGRYPRRRPDRTDPRGAGTAWSEVDGPAGLAAQRNAGARQFRHLTEAAVRCAVWAARPDRRLFSRRRSRPRYARRRPDPSPSRFSRPAPTASRRRRRK